MLGRVILFTLLLGGTVAVHLAWGTPEALGGPGVTVLFVFIAAIYVINILYAAALRHVRDLRWMAVVQIGVDLVASALLVHYTGGLDSAFVFFFLLLPITAAITLGRRAAFTAALVGAGTFSAITVAAALGWIPPPPGHAGQPRPPMSAVAAGLLANGAAILAIGALAGFLAEQLRTAARQMAAQQTYIDNLASLNADIIRCLTSGLVTVDDAGRVLTMNQAAAEILDCDAERAVGQRLADLSPELHHAAGSATGELRRGEIALDRGGGRVVLGVSVSPLTDHRGQEIGRIVNFQDITPLREMEEQVRRAQRLASLGRLSAGIAHEIRNPLASISGALELLRGQAGVRGEDQALMGIALREIERLDGLIQDLLAYARPRPPRLEPLDLGKEIRHLVASIAGLAGGEEAPRIDLAETKDNLWVKADRHQLGGVLWNLAQNAWQAGERQAVRVRVRGTEEQVLLEVADRGPGIPEEHRGHIFEPFFTTKEEGTGLGLATVHRVVEDHGGTIDVRCPPEGGTVFIIALPRVNPAALSNPELAVYFP